MMYLMIAENVESAWGGYGWLIPVLLFVGGGILIYLFVLGGWAKLKGKK